MKKISAVLIIGLGIILSGCPDDTNMLVVLAQAKALAPERSACVNITKPEALVGKYCIHYEGNGE